MRGNDRTFAEFLREGSCRLRFEAVQIGGEKPTLEARDSMDFDSGTPHGDRRMGPGRASFAGRCTPPP